MELRPRTAYWIFAVALVVGLWQFVFPSGFGFGAGWEPVAIARELNRSGTFGNLFQAGPSGPTAIIPPLFPLLLAGLMAILGDTPSFAIAASLVTVFLQALHAALLPWVSVRLFTDPRPGILAGLLAALSFRLMPQWDVMYTCCGILLFLLNASLATPRAGVITGLGAGLLMLTNAATILIAGPWLLYLYATQKPGGRQAAVTVAAMLLTVLPWMVRNQIRLGTFSIKNNLGFTLYVANSDCALASLKEGPASSCLSVRNPNKSNTELALLNELGETRYDAARKAEALRWVLDHKDAFTRLTLARVAAFWFPPEDRTFIVWLVTALSIPGFWLWIRRGLGVTPFLLGVVALYPVLYYLAVIDIRYRYPILWISLLSAGYALNEGAQAMARVAGRTRTTYPLPPSQHTGDRPAHT